MTEQEYAAELRLQAVELRLEADLDERQSEAVSESNPSFADYLRRRVAHKRHMANNRDGGR